MQTKVCRRERERTADDQLPVERYLTDIFDYLTVELTLETFKKKKKKNLYYISITKIIIPSREKNVYFVYLFSCLVLAVQVLQPCLVCPRISIFYLLFLIGIYSLIANDLSVVAA